MAGASGAPIACPPAPTCAPPTMRANWLTPPSGDRPGAPLTGPPPSSAWCAAADPSSSSKLPSLPPCWYSPGPLPGNRSL